MMRAKTVVPVQGLPKPTGVWSLVTTAAPGRISSYPVCWRRTLRASSLALAIWWAQTEQVIQNLKQALSGAGATLDDVVRVDVYTRDMSKFSEIHAVRRQHFTQDPPASTMVEVKSSTDERALIEITAIAVVA